MDQRAAWRSGLVFGASTCVKLATGLIIIRIISSMLGADGLGQLGQLMSTMVIVNLLAGGGIVSGVIKYVSEFEHDEPELKGYLGAGSCIVSLVGLVLGALILMTAGRLSDLLLGSPAYAPLLRCLAAAQLLIGVNTYTLSIISGHKDFGGFAWVNIAGSILGLAVTCFLIVRYQFRGAVLGLIVAPALMVAFSVPHAFRRGYLSMARLRPALDAFRIRRLLSFSGMLCVSAATIPVAQIIIRNKIAVQYGWTAAGYWQGVVRISDAYLQFVTVVLANYYLPELASARTMEALRERVAGGIKAAVPATLLMAAGVFLGRGLLQNLLFPPTFYPMRAFFLFQVIGDCLKIWAQTLGYITVAKGLAGVYVALELLQALLLVGFSWVGLRLAGPLGVTYAYALTFAIQLTVVAVLFRKYVSPGSRFYDYK